MLNLVIMTNFGRALLVAVLAVLWLGPGSSPVAAGQDDARLEPLFDRLKQADEGEAQIVEGLIWSIWHAYDGGDTSVPSLMRRGQAAMARQDFAAAETYYSQAIDKDPDFAEAWNRRATVRYLRDDYQGSVADISQTLAREPRHFGALSGLGLIYTQLDALEPAIAAFEAALEIHPTMPGARANVESLRERLAGREI